jgi:hypothetical protein
MISARPEMISLGNHPAHRVIAATTVDGTLNKTAISSGL